VGRDRGPAAGGWSQFCFAKLLLAHAQGIEAEILFCGPSRKKDWSGKPDPAAAGGRGAPKFLVNKI
jgi:hypothetical protein